MHITGDPAADELLSSDPFALLTGMLLDQQVPMETAFAGPYKIRSGSACDSTRRRSPAYDPEAFVELFKRTPAVHRFPARWPGACRRSRRHVVDEYGGDAAAIWRRAPDGAEVLKRLKALPGFGEQKAKIFLALLGKQRGVQPAGWREAAGAYGEDGSHRSVADIVDPESLAKVRATKQAAKAAAKSAK